MIPAIENYTVYILQCSDNSYYNGITNNVERRLYEHEEGLNPSCYTFKRRPVKLVFAYHFNNPVQAIGFEKQVKKWRRAKKEALINNKWDLLPELSRNYTDKNK